jgi:hypothetical protein
MIVGMPELGNVDSQEFAAVLEPEKPRRRGQSHFAPQTAQNRDSPRRFGRGQAHFEGARKKRLSPQGLGQVVLWREGEPSFAEFWFNDGMLALAFQSIPRCYRTRPPKKQQIFDEKHLSRFLPDCV